MNLKDASISPRRSIFSYSKVQQLMSALLRNRAFQIGRVAGSLKKYLNVGCGPNIYESFTNIDYQWRKGLDLCWDITRGIPIKPDSFDGIYTEHCLEHIKYEECQKVLGDIFRLLKKGGTLRLIVPDAELYINLYTDAQSGKIVSFPYVKSEEIFGKLTPMTIVNGIFRGHGHLYAYDFRTLKEMLTEAGFVDIERADFMVGANKDLLIDSEVRKVESLYIEAKK